MTMNFRVSLWWVTAALLSMLAQWFERMKRQFLSGLLGYQGFWRKKMRHCSESACLLFVLTMQSGMMRTTIRPMPQGVYLTERVVHKEASDV